MEAYKFHPNFILRTPLRPFQPNLNESEIRQLLQDAQIMEALYLASPVLHREVQKWLKGTLADDKKGKLLRSLYKYLMRLHTRCTPFGLFASCAIGHWAEEVNTKLNNPRQLSRHTRLDNEYLYALADHLENHHALRPYLKFHPNSSRQIHRQQLRYIEYFYDNGKRKHKLSAVYLDPYLNEVLRVAEKGALINELHAALRAFDTSLEDAEISNYLQAIIESQILNSELEPSLTGSSPLRQLIDFLRPLAAVDQAIEAILAPLERMQRKMELLDKKAVNTANDYQEAATLLEPLAVDHDPTHLFQVDVFRSGSSITLSQELQHELRACLGFLDGLQEQRSSTTLMQFMQAFHRKYGQQAIPLTEVVDNNLGIGFPVATIPSVANPLIQGVDFPAGTGQNLSPGWNAYDRWLFGVLQHFSRADHIDLSSLPKELQPIKQQEGQSDLGASLYTWFRMLSGGQIYLEGAGGSCAVNLISRFATAQEQIHTLAADLVAIEERHIGEEELLAEIVHLPESRTGNILLRPDLRRFEIPYLSRSAKPAEDQITVDDLLVSVDIANEEITLWSRKLKKKVIPRLSNAHNYANSPLPIYRFLCELQQHGEKRALMFDPGLMHRSLRYYPRIQWKHIILHPATWNLRAADLKNLRPDTIATWQEALSLPDLIILTEGDNELLLDLREPLACDVLCRKLSKSKRVKIQEFLPPDERIKDESGEGYTNEVLAFLYRTESPRHRPVDRAVLEANIATRAFGLGSEWLYYKLYTSPEQADLLIAEYLLPAGQYFLEKGWISDWFFIRYNDPENHLRFRLKLTSVSALPEVIQYLYRHFQPLLQQRILHRLQTDTYQQEIERYGAGCMDWSERWFMHDSTATAKMLSLIEGDQGEEIRWWYAARAIDVLLDAYSLNPEEKEELLYEMKSAFAREFRLDKRARTQLSAKYRQYQPILSRLFQTGTQASPLQELESVLQECRQGAASCVLAIKKNTEQPLGELLKSYIHMLCNRIFRSDQRKCEAVLYDFVHQALKTKHILARKQRQNDRISVH